MTALEIIALEIEREALMHGSAAAMPGHERRARIQQINELLSLAIEDYRKGQELRTRAALAALAAEGADE